MLRLVYTKTIYISKCQLEFNVNYINKLSDKFILRISYECNPYVNAPK